MEKDQFFQLAGVILWGLAILAALTAPAYDGLWLLGVLALLAGAACMLLSISIRPPR